MTVKTITTGFIFLLMFGSLSAQNLTIEKTWSGDKIFFSVSREANIFNYAVEGSNDSLNFEIIGAIKAKGYSLATLSYDFINYDKSYRYYRVKQIDMSGSCVAQMRGSYPENHPTPPNPSQSLEARDTSGGR